MNQEKFSNYSFNVLGHNGWKWEKERSLDETDFDVYSMTFLVLYEVKIYALITRHSGQLDWNGHYGVNWLEAEYEYDRPHTKEELNEMITAMGYAEKNLLTIGIPFIPDYKFNGKDETIHEKQIRNQELRESLKLEEQEQENENE